MAWKKVKVGEAIVEQVMVALRHDYEKRIVRKDTFEDFMRYNSIRPQERWEADQNYREKGSLKVGITIVHIAEQTTVLILYKSDHNGQFHFLSRTEHHGFDRGPKRQERIYEFLGVPGQKLLVG